MGFGESERGHRKIDVEWQLKRTWRSSQFHKANCSKCFLVDRVGSATRSRVLERDSERDRERERARERASKRAREREREREKEKRESTPTSHLEGRAPHLGHAFPMHLVLLVEHSSARGGLIRGIRVDCLHLGAVFVADRVTNEPPILLELYRGANDGADA